MNATYSIFAIKGEYTVVRLYHDSRGRFCEQNVARSRCIAECKSKVRTLRKLGLLELDPPSRDYGPSMASYDAWEMSRW